jgi:hypothetical protein
MKTLFLILALLAIAGGIILFRLAFAINSHGGGMYLGALSIVAFVFAGIFLLGAIITGWKKW